VVAPKLRRSGTTSVAACFLDSVAHPLVCSCAFGHLLLRRTQKRIRVVQCRRCAYVLFRLRFRRKVRQANDANDTNESGVDEADDGVHGVLHSEEDVPELAEEVHVEDVIEGASESVDILGVHGQEIGSWDEHPVGVTAERDGVGRGVGVWRMSAKVAASILGTARWDHPRSRTEKRQK
jgi:hypothetical protein